MTFGDFVFQLMAKYPEFFNVLGVLFVIFVFVKVIEALEGSR